MARVRARRALVFDYHLAPEHTHPAQVDDATAVYQWLLGAGGDPRDPLANPLYADLSGLGPIYIQVGGDEVLDDARRLAPHARALLEQYVAGFENADTAALERALRTDAAIEMVGSRTWFSGRVTCLRYLTHVIGSPGDWRMIPTLANGQPAAAAYHRHPAERGFGGGWSRGCQGDGVLGVEVTAVL